MMKLSEERGCARAAAILVLSDLFNICTPWSFRMTDWITHTGEDEPGGCSLPPKRGCRRYSTSAFTGDYPRWRIVGCFTLTLRTRAFNWDIRFVTSVISVWLHIYIDYTLKDIYLLQRRMGGVCRELMLCSLGLALIRISFRVRETLKNKYRMTLVRK